MHPRLIAGLRLLWWLPEFLTPDSLSPYAILGDSDLQTYACYKGVKRKAQPMDGHRRMLPPVPHRYFDVDRRNLAFISTGTTGQGTIQQYSAPRLQGWAIWMHSLAFTQPSTRLTRHLTPTRIFCKHSFRCGGV
jgi:hypothetical protein